MFYFYQVQESAFDFGWMMGNYEFNTKGVMTKSNVAQRQAFTRLGIQAGSADNLIRYCGTSLFYSAGHRVTCCFLGKI